MEPNKNQTGQNKTSDSPSTFELAEGSLFCPASRPHYGNDNDYYMKLTEVTEVKILDGFIVYVGGIQYMVVPESYPRQIAIDHYKTLIEGGYMNTVLPLQAGTRYVITDPGKDPIGTTESLKFTESVGIKPDTKIYLKKGTRLMTTDVNHSFLIVDDVTNCTI